MQGNELKTLYFNRFGEKTLEAKNRVWKILCEMIFNKYMPKNAVVYDVGAGSCEFINNVRAGKKIAVDINPDIKNYASKDVEVLNADCLNMTSVPEGSADIVFMSNFLEHLNNREEILQLLKESFRILKNDGKIIIMGPNIKYLGGDYWDFFDHKVPLTHASICEVLNMAGFKIGRACARFMPYTFNSQLPQNDFLIKLYLSIPFLWKIFGKQFLVIGCKRGNGRD